MSSSRPSSRSSSRPGPGLRLALAACLVLSACGKKGPPLPPLRDVPAPTQDLAARQRGTQLLLSFTYPKATPGGQALAGISGVEVWEVVRPLPPTPPTPPPAPPAAGTTPTAATATTPTAPTAPVPAAPAPAAPAAPAPTTPAAAVPPATTAPAPGTTPPAATPPGTPGAPGATPAAPADQLPALDPREFNTNAKKILTLATADIAAATEGDKLVVALPAPIPPLVPLAPVIPAAPAVAAPATSATSASPGEVHHFAVRTLGPTGDRSEWSNVVRIVPKAPPAAPAEIALNPRPDGIEVRWKPVPGALGYLIYRRDAAVKTYGNAVKAVPAPAETAVDTDAKLGSSYIYAVTSVAQRAPLLESAIQSEREVRYADRFPPPPVRDLVALAEVGQVRLVWSASDAPDLAGYRIYRRDREGGELRRLNDKPVAETEYTDSGVASGHSYVYRVVAVDAQGNESEAQETQASTR